MDWAELQAATGGFAPPADDMHDDLFAPQHEAARERIEGVFEDRGNRSAGFERGRGSWR